MATTTNPFLEPDGTQVYPVEHLAMTGKLSYRQATGEIRWNPIVGLTFKFEIVHDADLVPPLHGGSPLLPAGQISLVPDHPAWTGTVPGGGNFRIFLPKGKSSTIRTLGQASCTSTTLQGQAAFVEVEIPRSSPLAFWHESPLSPRYFIAGLDLLPFPHNYDVTYTEDGTHTERACRCLILTESPKLQIIPCKKVGVDDGCWIAYEGEASASIQMPPAPCEDARAFASFIVGRNIPFLWTDRFVDETRLVRLFHGSHRPPANIIGNEQPLPVGVIAEAFTHGVEICPRLPALFEAFRQLRNEYNVEFINSPIWTAFDSYVDDRLTYACVSLERLATAHADWLKNNPSRVPPAEIFLTSDQGKVIRDLFRGALKAVASALGIDKKTVKILNEKRIANIHVAPNADKLKQVFTDLAITLTAEEEDALSNRNRTLHGNPTLHGTTMAEVEAESKRFNILRTLINKALLRLLGYTGAFMDYGDPDRRKGFGIKMMTAPAVVVAPDQPTIVGAGDAASTASP